MSAALNPSSKVLVLGANGQVARHTTLVLLKAGAELTLFLRRAGRLANPDPSRVRIVEGDVLDAAALRGRQPGEKYRSVLDPFRDSAAVIEGSDLDYTILRPGWFNREPSTDYRLTRKGEPFIGHDVTLNGLSALIAALATTPGLHARESLGVSHV